MKELSKSEKILIAILLITLVGYVYFQYIFTPLSTKVQSVQNSADKLEQELLRSKLMAASNKKMTEEMNALKVNYNKYVELMPKSDMSAEIIREVNRLAADTKVTLTNLTIGNGIEYKSSTNAANTNVSDTSNTQLKAEAQASITKTMEVPVSISFKGDYSSFTAFINSLETSSRIANIGSVNVEKGTNAGDSELAITLNVSFLYVQDGTPVENNYDFNSGNYGKVNPFK
jgi:Tfp pilus assembly protein PilO